MNKKCQWKHIPEELDPCGELCWQNEEYWETGCGNAHQFMNDGPKENHYKYCPYCGREIEVIE